MKKKTFLKSLSFTSLALLMGAAGVFAFAPLGASPSVANANEMVDQINTKADGENIKYAPSPLGLDPENDPVIYTTESGLEIKYGGESVSDQLASGKPLSGYPYFTMGTYNGYAVNWVIIGRNTNETVFGNLTTQLFSSWKTNNAGLPSATYKNYGDLFFKNTFESTTPAGSAINGVVPSKSYVVDATKISKSVVGNDEVPSGCVLAISECCLGYSYFNCTSAASSTYNATGSQNFGARYRYLTTTGAGDGAGGSLTWSTTAGTLYTYINNLYSTNLGLTTAQKNMIQGQKLKTIYGNGSGNTAFVETSSTDGNTTYNMFPLAGFKDGTGTTYSSVENENFCISTYLTTNDLRKAYQIGATTSITYWLRSSESTYPKSARSVGDTPNNNLSGTGELHGHYTRFNFGVRPACVIKLG